MTTTLGRGAGSHGVQAVATHAAASVELGDRADR